MVSVMKSPSKVNGIPKKIEGVVKPQGYCLYFREKRT